ncbi:hypothetical protein [Rhodospirillum sp. A1_3_36]|uniref:hypothetical protein n=1 Tax=Rhodospirillum sp. A1_3_36 TaxID=3391666 RepID=UPI0039A4842E
MRPGSVFLALAVLVTFFGTLSPSAWAQDIDWTSDVPPTLKGTWSVNGQCKGHGLELLIFSNGGYRWSKPDGSWGFARGSFAYSNPRSYRVLFKVRHLFPTPGYDSVLTVSGSTLRKTNLKSNTSRRYRKCQD